MLGALLDGTTSPGVFLWRGRPDRDVTAMAAEAGWDVLRLDTREARSREDFYDAVEKDWALPAWFGRNLDALWDVLGDRVTGSTLIIWDGADAFASVDPDLASMVIGVLRDAVSQADRLAVLLRRTPGVSAEPMMLSGLDGLL